MAPGTEAPVGDALLLPEYRALCMAENATHTLHNLLTLRGALVRDPHVWSQYLTEAIDTFGDRTDVVFASHHWPTWTGERVVALPLDPARPLRLPARPDPAPAQPGLPGRRDRRADRAAARARERVEHARLLRVGQPQREGHLPALHGLVRRQPGAPLAAPARRAGHALRRRARGPRPGRRARAGGLRRRRLPLGGDAARPRDLHRREPRAARELLADTLEQLGYGAENGTWRNFFLSGATELREGNFGTPTATSAPAIVAQLTPEQLFDAIAISVNGPKAWDLDLSINVVFTDLDAAYRLTLRNGVLIHRKAEADRTPRRPITTTKPRLLGVMAGDIELAGARHHRRRVRAERRCSACSTRATRTSTSSCREPRPSTSDRGHRRRAGSGR